MVKRLVQWCDCERESELGGGQWPLGTRTFSKRVIASLTLLSCLFPLFDCVYVVCINTFSLRRREKIGAKKVKKKKIDAIQSHRDGRANASSRPGSLARRFLHTEQTQLELGASVLCFSSAPAETRSLVSVCLVWMPKRSGLISPRESRTLMGFYYLQQQQQHFPSKNKTIRQLSIP